ncbi:MAG: hypothetical protein JXA64_10430 [Candidatus Fermentibacteraceae bacterium]|nr:hypothetical protein [Candidatus Fermentibacteraceae bacterium]MBN2609518.1 hypothetical protein [Candidatus Fermentibacteraceae bacterium]
MKACGRDVKSLLAVFTQFWNPVRAYRLLLDTRAAGLAIIASVLVISVAGYIPALLVDWEEFEAQWISERVPELMEEGMAQTAADSVVAGELVEIREMAGNLPMARLVERGVIGLLAALTAFGVVYAVEGRKVGRLTDYLTSSILSQSAYMLIVAVLTLLVTVMELSPATRLNLSIFVPVDTVDPTRIHVFMFRFLESVDIPSIACLTIWGAGLSAMLERNRSWGIRLVFSVYILGILLISLPVMFAPAA